MSFTDQFHGFLIGPGNLYDSLTKIDESPTLTNDGWDGLRVTYLQRIEGATAEDIADLFPVGAQLGSRNWWISGVNPTQVMKGFWKFEVDFKGWASDKPALVKVGASADSQTAQNVLAPTAVGDTVGALFAKVETHENMPTIAVTFLTKTLGTDSLTGSVGTAVTPPVTIDVPDSVWDFLTEYVWHWPQGWVLMGEDQDRLPGSPAALVTHNYKYIRDKTPG